MQTRLQFIIEYLLENSNQFIENIENVVRFFWGRNNLWLFILTSKQLHAYCCDSNTEYIEQTGQKYCAFLYIVLCAMLR